MPDRVVDAGQTGDLQLRAHAVGARDQHRLLVFSGEQRVGEIELEQAGETALQPDHPGGIGPGDQAWQPGHRIAIEFQIDAGVFVGCFGHDCLPGEESGSYCNRRSGDRQRPRRGVARSWRGKSLTRGREGAKLGNRMNRPAALPTALPILGWGRLPRMRPPTPRKRS